jgi:beta-galactosidase
LAPNTAWSQAKPAFAPNEMDSILYGAAYYTEYMPYERLEQDAQLMQQAGLTVVRMGESSWGLWEPKTGASNSGGWTAWWSACTRPGSR